MAVDLLSTAAPPILYWQPGDESARKVAIFYHDLQHRTIRKAATLLGISLGAGQLTGELTRDWYARHMLIHKALKGILPESQRQTIGELSDTRGEDDPNFCDWQHRHALIHARLDTAFGIV